MSLTIATTMAARIEAEASRAGSALADWIADGHDMPTVSLGYRHPTGAAGWPFVAVVPSADVRDLRLDRRRRGSESADVSIICGYRLSKVARGEEEGLVAVDALADAVLSAFESPWRFDFRGDRWEARTAERVNAVFQHPNYEIDILIDFGPVGAPT